MNQAPKDLPQPRAPLTHTRTNAQGFIEIIDLHTGRVLCVQATPHDQYLNAKFDNLTRINTPEGVVWIEKTIDPHRVIFGSKIPYSLSWADLLAGHIVEGMSLRNAVKEVGLEYPLVIKWRREYPDFALTLEQAAKDRAEQYHHKALETAEASQPHTVSQDKLRVETYKWAAEKADPDKFGQKLKVSGKVDHAVTVVLDTGIRRKGDAGYSPIEMKDVQAAGEAAQHQVIEHENQSQLTHEPPVHLSEGLQGPGIPEYVAPPINELGHVPVTPFGVADVD